MRRLYQAIINSDPWLAALVVGCFAVAVACTIFSQETTEFPADKTVITLCRGGYKRDREQMREIKAAFEQKHPDICLNVIRSNVTRKADTMIAAGVAPDVLFVPCDTVDYYIQAGALRDLTPYIEQDPELRKAFGRTLFDDDGEGEPDFIEPLVTPFVREVDGRRRLYAIPISYAPFFVYYSKDLFDRYNVPYPDENWDWNDLLEKATALTRDVNGRRPDQPGFDQTRVATYGFNLATWQHGVEGFIRQNGGRLVNEDGTKVVADDPRTVEALQFLYDLKWTYHVVPTGEGANARNIAFDKGTIGMMLWGSFYISTLNDQAQELDWDVAPLPRGPGGKRASVVFANGWGVTTGSANPDQAFEYLRFLVSDEGMRIASKHQVFLSTRRSMLRMGGLVDSTRKPASRWALTHDID
ncbi:MAG: sugar ABC transporter substrate-binding protein, partial [Phycisphaerae bacterium]|nr:sugar ABC transporter substrate-binding protein [Phycisphaerae bacterium]